MHVYLDNLENPIECQGHRSKVKVTGVFLAFFSECIMPGATRGLYLALTKAW